MAQLAQLAEALDGRDMRFEGPPALAVCSGMWGGSFVQMRSVWCRVSVSTRILAQPYHCGVRSVSGMMRVELPFCLWPLASRHARSPHCPGLAPTAWHDGLRTHPRRGEICGSSAPIGGFASFGHPHAASAPIALIAGSSRIARTPLRAGLESTS